MFTDVSQGPQLVLGLVNLVEWLIQELTVLQKGSCLFCHWSTALEICARYLWGTRRVALGKQNWNEMALVFELNFERQFSPKGPREKAM